MRYPDSDLDLKSSSVSLFAGSGWDANLGWAEHLEGLAEVGSRPALLGVIILFLFRFPMVKHYCLRYFLSEKFKEFQVNLINQI